MQEVWESYMKPVDGHPAAVAFNAEVHDALPDDRLATMGFVKLSLAQPAEGGLIAEAEADELAAIEDRLEMESLRYRLGKYVGRIVTGGTVTFIYYLQYDFEWPAAVAEAMAAYGHYRFEYGSRPDPEWEVYLKLLYPTGREWQMIRNHHACDRLRAAGDNLRLQRAIEHRVYFDSSEHREGFAARIGSEGFAVQHLVEPTEALPHYGVAFYRIDAPHYYDIDALTVMLIDLAEHYEGQYDGWETSLVKM